MSITTVDARSHDESAGSPAHAHLAAWVQMAGPLAVAVSGGVDSLTLATLAHRVGRDQVTAFHATSAAVPAAARERVRSWAARIGIAITIVDAGELSDPRYLANPVDRCRFCKADLYAAISRHTDALIVSGANTDDLGEWRPGLLSAAAAGVRHPFLECDVDKDAIRVLARELDLGEFAELPAAPCLASRIETGIAVDEQVLRAVDAVEQELARRAGPGDIRCRVRRSGIAIEMEPAVAARLTDADRAAITTRVRREFPSAAEVRFEGYRRGAAFLGVPATNTDLVGTRQDGSR